MGRFEALSFMYNVIPHNSHLRMTIIISVLRGVSEALSFNSISETEAMVCMNNYYERLIY